MKQIAWDEVMKRLEVASKICNDASPVQVEGPIHVGVDLGTADVVVMAVDDNGMPVSAFLEWATVVRDGVVVDYHGAITIVKRLVSMTEERLGRKITEASTSYPPGTDARLSTNILDAANLRLVSTADEPSCLARLARLDRAAVVDIGGGTTGTAVISNGKVIASVDDATGGHHVTLAMSGALSVPYEEAVRSHREAGFRARFRHREGPYFRPCRGYRVSHRRHVLLPRHRAPVREGARHQGRVP